MKYLQKYGKRLEKHFSMMSKVFVVFFFNGAWTHFRGVKVIKNSNLMQMTERSSKWASLFALYLLIYAVIYATWRIFFHGSLVSPIQKFFDVKMHVYKYFLYFHILHRYWKNDFNVE